jgi:hypothetical protein
MAARSREPFAPPIGMILPTTEEKENQACLEQHDGLSLSRWRE